MTEKLWFSEAETTRYSSGMLNNRYAITEIRE